MSSFTDEQCRFIILKFGEVKSVLKVRRAFRLKYFQSSPRQVPHIRAFHRLIKKFENHGTVQHLPTPAGKRASVDDVEKVKRFFENSPEASIRSAVAELALSYGRIWRILKQDLKWKAYKPHLAQALSSSNKISRLQACEFWLSQPEDWFQKVIWTDEKWFVLKQAPNRQNSRCWAPSHPHEIIDCKKAHGQKVMAWVGMVDGRILPVVWFEGSVTSTVYLEQVLKSSVWPTVIAVATRRGFWYQPDGASSHVTGECLAFLREKFGDRVISRKTEHHWPPYSPDLSPLDFSFWSQAMAHLLRCKPSTIEQLKSIEEDFAINMEEDDVRKMTRHGRRRAELCVQQAGGHFQHLL